MGDMRVRSQSQPQIQPQVKPSSAPIQMTPGTKVRSKTPEELLALQQKAKQSKDLGMTGTRAQINDLKARVKQIKMQNVQPIPELSNLQAFKKHGGTVLKGIGTVLKTPFVAGATYVSSSFAEGAENRSLGSTVLKTGKEQLEKARSIQGDSTRLGELRGEIDTQLQLEAPDWEKVDNLLKETGSLLKVHGLPTGSVDEARQQLWNNPLTVREVLSIITAAQPIMEVMSESLTSKGKALKSTGGGLLHEGNRHIAQGVQTLGTLTSPIVSVTNVIAQGVEASSTAKSFIDTVTAGNGLLVSGSTLSGIMVGAGALQIVGEGLEMYQNVGKLNKALNRVEMARAVVAEGPEREKMALAFEKKAQELEQPETRLGKIKMFFSRKSSRLEEVANLRAKAAAVRELSTTPISEEAKVVANQIIKRADSKFKIAKIVKNVVGIAAGAIAIAVAVGAMATPVGWAVAGVALAGSVGLAIYAKVKSSQRQGKIDDLNKVQQQCQLKMDTKQEQKTQLKAQIQEIEKQVHTQIQEQNPLSGSERPSDKLRFDALETSITTSKETLTQLQSQLAQLDTDLGELETIQKESVLQLLGASPKDGAKAMIEGIKKGDPAMRYLAETVLKVPSPELLPEKEAIKLLARGMSLDPGK